MKILQVINSLGTGGAEKLVVDLCVGMQERGHDVEIICLWGDSGIPMESAHRAGIQVRILGTRNKYLMRIPTFIKWTKTADVVHVHLWPSLYLGVLTPKRKRLFYTEHSTSNRRRRNRIFRILEPWIYARYERVIAVSTGVQEALVEHLSRESIRRRLSVIRNGISPEFLTQPVMASKSVTVPLKVISIGTLDKRKNFITAIRAIAHFPESQLTIVGDGPDFSQLFELTKTLGIRDRVHLIGTRSDVMKLLDENDILLSTSIHEGFALVVAEAMARGLPVVGPNISGLNETVRDGQTGILYSPNASPKEIAGALRALTHDPVLYANMSRNSALRAKGFGVNKTVQNYIELYESTFEISPGSSQ